MTCKKIFYDSELSAATNALAFALQLLSRGDADTIVAIRRRLESPPIEIGNDRVTQNQYWREGVNRFSRRLLESLPRHDA